MSVLTRILKRSDVTQDLCDQAASLASALLAFDAVSWPYMGSDWSLVRSQVEGIDVLVRRLVNELTCDRSGRVPYAVKPEKLKELEAVAKLNEVTQKLVFTGMPRQKLIAIIGEFLLELRVHAESVARLCDEALAELKTAPQPARLALIDTKARLDSFIQFDDIYNAAGGIRVQLDGLIAFASIMKAPEPLQDKLSTAARVLSG